MKETAQLQKQILEKKLNSIEQSLAQILVKRNNLVIEEEKLRTSKVKISETLRNFGIKKEKEETTTPEPEVEVPTEPESPEEPMQRRSLTEEERAHIPTFILNNPDKLEEFRSCTPEYN